MELSLSFYIAVQESEFIQKPLSLELEWVQKCWYLSELSFI